MNPIAQEYLGPTGANGNGNGNGHTKIFDLTPKQDMLLSKIVPEARRRVCLNNLLSAAARMFFCFLTDTSLLFGVNIRKGVVKFSDADLAFKFKVDPRTVRSWKRELEATGEIWTSDRWMKNSFPVTVYNVTCIPEVGPRPEARDAESADGSLVEDFASNRRRRPVGRDGLTGKFARRDTPPSPEAILTERPKIEDLAVKSTPNEFFCPSPAAKNSRPPRLKTAVADGEKQPQGAEDNNRGGRLKTADNRETGVGETVFIGVRGEALPPEKQFQDWLKSLDSLFPSRLKDLEKAFTLKLIKAQSPEAKAEWKKRLKIVQDRLLGGPVKDRPPQSKPAHVDRRPSMDPAKAKSKWEAAMKSLPASLQPKQKAASREAAK